MLTLLAVDSMDPGSVALMTGGVLSIGLAYLIYAGPRIAKTTRFQALAANEVRTWLRYQAQFRQFVAAALLFIVALVFMLVPDLAFSLGPTGSTR
jgi:hypothetical protein